MKTFFSIIIPVYNTYEKYLIECLDSFKLLNYDNYEIIVIDDGSNQETKDILERYKDELKLNIIHQKNKGISASRLVGINISKGEYILFIDSDDIIDKNALIYLDEIIGEYKPDIITRNNKRFKESINNITYQDHFMNEGIVDKNTALNELCKLHINGIGNKVCKKKLYEGMDKFIDTSFINGEDLQQSTYVLMKANSIYYTERPVDYYRINDEYREYYGTKIISDINYLVPTYKLLFINSNEYKAYLNTFLVSAINSIIYTSFKICNHKSFSNNRKQMLDELNKQEIVQLIKKEDISNISFVSKILFKLLINKHYFLLFIASKLYKLIFGFEKSLVQ